MDIVPISPRSTDALDGVLDGDDRARLDAALGRQQEVLDARRLWHVNSTAAGGGVAEMLATLLPYAAGAGIDVGWLVIEGGGDFFEVTKRLHNRLHGRSGDGGPLGPAERACYEATLRSEEAAVLGTVRPGDVAVLHDPQTAGLVPVLRSHGAHVLWRCHVGTDTPDGLAQSAWAFLGPDVRAAAAAVFTRHAYVWDGLARDGVVVLPPCIDVCSPKNRPLPAAEVTAVLAAAAILPAAAPSAASAHSLDALGGIRVGRRALMTEVEPVPAGARLVTQVSRWDALKDPVGLLHAFADHGPPDPDVHLLLVGPNDGVADDPESTDTFADVRRHWASLRAPDARRVHLARVPMDDPAENAVVVNAVQRRSDVVVQKSLAEGFGLTVAEAMWKARPVLASRVGGIQDQIVDGESGLLVDDPADLPAFGAAMRRLLGDRALARRLGEAAQRRVCDHFLPVQHAEAEADLLAQMLARPDVAIAAPRASGGLTR
jgi:trehalose synthase